jgi:hypothetical protein
MLLLRARGVPNTNYCEEYDFLDCNVVQCGKVHRRFGGTYRRHLQGRRVSQARNQQEAGGEQSLIPARKDLRERQWYRDHDLPYTIFSTVSPWAPLHTIACRGLCVTYMTGVGLDDWIYWHLIQSTRNYMQYSAIAILHTLQFTAAHALRFQSSLAVSWQRIS